MTLKTDVLFLQKDRFEIYSSTLMRTFEFLFVYEIIQDFDVKNNELLENLINVFISSNKIPPSELVIVVSEGACFIKDFAQPVSAKPLVAPGQPATLKPVITEDLQKQIDQFIQHVPFDKVASVTFPLSNGMKVCATNEGLYKDIISPFEKLGFKIDSIIPGIAYGSNLLGKTTLDKVMADFILQSTNSVKQNNFLTKTVPQEQINENKEERMEVYEVEDQKPEKTNKKRLILLIGVFAVLIVVLIIVYIQSTR